MSIKNAKVDDFIKLIETNFREYAGKIGRLDVKWGTWSVVMNREIHRRIKEKDPETKKLAEVYGYWVVMSQLLELKFRYKGKYFGKNKIKSKIREAKRIKEHLSE